MLKERWQRLLESLGKDSGSAMKIYAIIVDCYKGQGRYYHNLQHIAECLAQLEECSYLLSNVHAVELALWFHDLVYIPLAQYNEDISAAVACTYIYELTNDASLADNARQLILATKHQTALKLTPADAGYVSDIDLTILGAPKPRFWQYEQEIRKEYAVLDHNVYAQQRRQVLQALVQRERLYQTAYFRDKYELKARQNITALLAELSAGTMRYTC